jgi:membrane protein insertase Oxa1/YidC/SpoIIIJ
MLLPPLEYLTLNDKVLTVVYVIIIYSASEILVQRKFNERDDYRKAREINKKMRYTLPIIIVGTFLLLLPL